MKRFILSVLLLGVPLIFFADQSPALAQWLEHIDLPGHDFLHRPVAYEGIMFRPGQSQSYNRGLWALTKGAARKCQEECDRDSRCKAWTFVREESQGEPNPLSLRSPWRVAGTCWLKDEVPSTSRPMANAISGIIPPPPTVTSTQPAPRETSGPPPPPPTSFESHPLGWEMQMDRPGSDYLNVTVRGTAPSACQSICQNDPRCRAWTMVMPASEGEKAQCWLKDSVPSPVANRRCVSGVKR